MPGQNPIEISIPHYGVCVAESVHGMGFRMAEHRDEYFQIVYVQSGEALCHLGSGRSVTLHAGDFFPIPKGRIHGFEDIQPATLILLVMSSDWVNNDHHRVGLWEGLKGVRAPLTPDPWAKDELELAIKRMTLEQTGQRTGKILAIQMGMTQLLIQCVRLGEQLGRDNTSEGQVQRFIERLRENFYQPWDLDSAAASTGMSRRRFSSLYRGITGKTFVESLTDLRLSHASRLLNKGNNSIAGIAFACGFNDVSHFYRLFKKRFGMAPKQWMERSV